MNQLSRKKVSILVSIPFLMITMLLLSAFVPPPYAQNVTPTPKFPKVDDHRDQVLKNELKREQTWLNTQQNHLDKANQAAAKAQELIDAAKSEGKDVAALEAGLAVFKNQISSAQSAHDVACGILSTHAGFDADGNITDRDAAHQTIISARQSLENAHKMIDQAVRDLNRVVKDWKRDHQSGQTTTPAG
jgi:uncharacterized protein YlxW (UPF0749 family)